MVVDTATCTRYVKEASESHAVIFSVRAVYGVAMSTVGGDFGEKWMISEKGGGPRSLLLLVFLHFIYVGGSCVTIAFESGHD